MAVSSIRVLTLLTALLIAGCAVDPVIEPESTHGRIVCDTYLILDMCVRDLIGDGTTDMVYFTDTNEIFMYQQGRKSAVAEVMPFHRCAVPLGEDMQKTTNRILLRGQLSLTEELAITRDLMLNYMAAKPEIDACNDRFDALEDKPETPEEEFYMGDPDEWGDA